MGVDLSSYEKLFSFRVFFRYFSSPASDTCLARRDPLLRSPLFLLLYHLFPIAEPRNHGILDGFEIEEVGRDGVWVSEILPAHGRGKTPNPPEFRLGAFGPSQDTYIGIRPLTSRIPSDRAFDSLAAFLLGRRSRRTNEGFRGELKGEKLAIRMLR